MRALSEYPDKEVCLERLAVVGNYVWCLAIIKVIEGTCKEKIKKKVLLKEGTCRRK